MVKEANRTAWIVFVASCTLYGFVMVALLFLSAGRWDLPFFWAYIVIFSAYSIALPLAAGPELAKERMSPGPGGRDMFTRVAWIVLFFGQMVLAGLDVGRLHWGDSVPVALQALGLLGVTLAMAVWTWAIATNRFFSHLIRIQEDRGHVVVTGGPYHYIRHPGYASFSLLLPCTALAFGSWLAMIPGILLVIVIFRRTFLEDGILQRELRGYREYSAQVPWRLVPGLW
jgi:protein-S-isoprenylcysteine O-methyltransferase Ste14